MYKPGEVFQPKAFPKMTYIDRSFDEDSTYEEELQEALEDTGTLVVIIGASKSGNQDKIPTRLNIVNSVKHIENIIKGKVPSLDTVEWKDGCLYILDPFLLFYLRWGSVWQR